MMFTVCALLSTLVINTVVAQPIDIESTAATMITTMVTFPSVGGINFETDTFNWSTVSGDVVVGMDDEMTAGYGNTDTGYGYGNGGMGYGYEDGGVDMKIVTNIMRYVPYEIVMSTHNTVNVDGLIAPLTASIKTVSLNNARCRSTAEISATMDFIMEIDPDCVFTWVTRFHVGSSTREVLVQTLNDSLPMRVNLSQFIPENASFFEVEQMSDGSVMNVFTDTVSISAEDLASMAALLNSSVCVPSFSQCNADIECCEEGQICMVKNEFYSQCRPTDQPFEPEMCMCPCERPLRA
jgi:hypothetical protein